ncbi:fungal protein [Schizosaccharomyces japonicus yFS275]|uniref:Fungal protein n=1 Tax=Schizosaccharomyces japonicus (strain yFS275 / FY16936) TaxID=402676 RepID=B6K000_SCHJY|nr:fungal protein [Schizosaccharomyces japonicus yFS275]EEB06150.1 fungal protein [Schizosaccharomyces japonicus yFS275]
MRIRNATPSFVLLGIAVVFFALACCTAPVSSRLTLSKLDDIRFGIFGYCTDVSNCIDPRIGYNYDFLNTNTASGYRLSANVRYRASFGLVLVPVSACVCAFAFLMLLFAHLGFVARSPSYFNVVAAVIFFNIFLTAISFIICVITFIPHIRWISWLVLANTGIQLIVLFTLFIARRQAAKLQNKHIRRSASFGDNPYTLQDNSNMFTTNASLPKFAELSFEKPSDAMTVASEDSSKPLRYNAASPAKLKPTYSNSVRSVDAETENRESGGYRFPFGHRNNKSVSEEPGSQPPSYESQNPWSVADIPPVDNASSTPAKGKRNSTNKASNIFRWGR